MWSLKNSCFYLSFMPKCILYFVLCNVVISVFYSWIYQVFPSHGYYFLCTFSNFEQKCTSVKNVILVHLQYVVCENVKNKCPLNWLTLQSGEKLFVWKIECFAPFNSVVISTPLWALITFVSINYVCILCGLGD